MTYCLTWGEVIFIDSSGLGLLVRLLTSTRSAGGDLKLCQVPENVRKVLKLTNISSLFDAFETEEEGILAFYRRKKAPSRPTPTGITVLCVDQSANMLAYLREVLTRSGYHVLTSNNLRDSLILLRATRPGSRDPWAEPHRRAWNGAGFSNSERGASGA